MALDTVVLAVGPGDRKRTDELADAVIDVVGGGDAEVVLLHVFTDEEFDEAVGKLDYEFGDRPDPDEVAERHTTVRTIGGMLDDVDIDHVARGAVGEHGEVIVEQASELGADLLVVGGRKRSPAGKAVFGSTAQYVMLNADCPVTYVRGEGEE